MRKRYELTDGVVYHIDREREGSVSFSYFALDAEILCGSLISNGQTYSAGKMDNTPTRWRGARGYQSTMPSTMKDPAEKDKRHYQSGRGR